MALNSPKTETSGVFRTSITINSTLHQAAEKKFAPPVGNLNFSALVDHLLRKELGWPKTGSPKKPG